MLIVNEDDNYEDELWVNLEWSDTVHDGDDDEDDNEDHNDCG